MVCIMSSLIVWIFDTSHTHILTPLAEHEKIDHEKRLGRIFERGTGDSPNRSLTVNEGGVKVAIPSPVDSSLEDSADASSAL